MDIESKKWKVLVAPNAFKGSLSAQLAAEIISVALEELGCFEVRKIPIADGGDGTVEVLVNQLSAEEKIIKTTDALGRPITSKYAWWSEKQIAMLAISSASGIAAIRPDELNPFLTSTFGSGIVLKEMIELEPKAIWIGLGGSATIDAGMGALAALGANIWHKPQAYFDHPLQKISFDSFWMQKLKDIPIHFLSDVNNPFLGDHGAIPVFGPQKGLKKEDFGAFHAFFEEIASIYSKYLGEVDIQMPGLGAAGGFALPFVAMGNASIHSGFEFISQALDLEQHLQWADLVVTGEGALDLQSIQGKGPVALAQKALEKGCRVIAFTGKWDERDLAELHNYFWKICPLCIEPKPLELAIKEAKKDLKAAVFRELSDFKGFD